VSKAVRVTTTTLEGAGAELVTVEAHFEPASERQKNQRTEIQLTGLPDPVIRESRGRLLSALGANSLRLGAGRLHLNLVPAARPKSGAMLDLALCLSAAAAGMHLSSQCLLGTVFIGEVGLDGTLHDVPGGLAAGMAAMAQGFDTLIAPPRTAAEAANLEGLEVFQARSLGQVVSHLSEGGIALKRLVPARDASSLPTRRPLLDVRGQSTAKRAAVVAAAGEHALLLIGPPGVGKTMIARRLVQLRPNPSLDERLEITRVQSAIGRWPENLVSERPFRAPHHTASYAGLVGGGIPLSPGEITLAHEGVLFLDELPEFQREALEAMRQPLESGSISISRAGRQLTLPARFQLVAAMNPCPCGYYGSERPPCRCSPHAIDRYRRRLSGPLLDRLELRIALTAPAPEELVRPIQADPNAGQEALAVHKAHNFRIGRGQATPNALLQGADLDRFAVLNADCCSLIERAARRRALSARAVQALRRVSRTLADIEESAAIDAPHLMEAIALRSQLDGS
jgi:magnesium chelatase family protein